LTKVLKNVFSNGSERIRNTDPDPNIFIKNFEAYHIHFKIIETRCTFKIFHRQYLRIVANLQNKQDGARLILKYSAGSFTVLSVRDPQIHWRRRPLIFSLACEVIALLHHHLQGGNTCNWSDFHFTLNFTKFTEGH